MSVNLAYPSVPVFPQSSILLKKGEGRDSTPTETAPGAFQIAAAQPRRVPGAHTYAVGVKFLTGLREWMRICTLHLAIEVCRDFMTAGSTCRGGRNYALSVKVLRNHIGCMKLRAFSCGFGEFAGI